MNKYVLVKINYIGIYIIYIIVNVNFKLNFNFDCNILYSIPTRKKQYYNHYIINTISYFLVLNNYY